MRGEGCSFLGCDGDGGNHGLTSIDPREGDGDTVVVVVELDNTFVGLSIVSLCPDVEVTDDGAGTDDGAVAVDAVADGTDADIVGRSVRGALHRKQNLLAASFGVPQLGQFF